MEKLPICLQKPNIVVLFIFSFAIALLLHWKSLGATYYWDDKAFIFLSPSLDIASPFAYWFRGTAFTKAWPLSYTVFWCLRKLFDQELLPFRLLLLFFHSLNTTILFVLLKRFFGRFAWLGALLFLVHPLNVETLSWVMQLSSAMSLSWLLLSLTALLKFNDTAQKKYYALALVAFIASLASKSAGTLFPILFFALLLQKQSLKNAMLKIAPFIAAAIYFLFLAVVGIYSFDNEVFFNQNFVAPPIIQSPLLVKIDPPPAIVKKKTKAKKTVAPTPTPAPEPIAPIVEINAAPFPEKYYLPINTMALNTSGQDKFILYIKNSSLSLLLKISNAGNNFVFYVTKFIFPRDLQPVYDDRKSIPGSAAVFLVLSILSAWSLWRLRRKNEPALLGLAISYCAFIPTSGIFYVTYMKYSLVADRWAYFLLPGFIIIALTAIAALEPKITDLRVRRLAMLVFMAIIIEFALRTLSYSDTFNSQPRSPQLRQNIPAQPWPPGR
jgi:hypothetical protein